MMTFAVLAGLTVVNLAILLVIIRSARQIERMLWQRDQQRAVERWQERQP